MLRLFPSIDSTCDNSQTASRTDPDTNSTRASACACQKPLRQAPERDRGTGVGPSLSQCSSCGLVGSLVMRPCACAAGLDSSAGHGAASAIAADLDSGHDPHTGHDHGPVGQCYTWELRRWYNRHAALAQPKVSLFHRLRTSQDVRGSGAH